MVQPESPSSAPDTWMCNIGQDNYSLGPDFSCSKLKAMFPCPGQHHNSRLFSAQSQGEDRHKNTPLSTLDH